MPRGVYVSDKRGRKSRPVEERLWPRTGRNPANGCLEWTGGTNGNGRGVIGVRDASRPNGIRMEQTHRVAWELVHGPISEGRQINHHCDNPLCCDVVDTENHCYLGGYAGNNQERSEHGRHHARRGKPITQAIVAEIRRRLAGGEQGKTLAAEFLMSEQNVSRIKLHQTWA